MLCDDKLDINQLINSDALAGLSDENAIDTLGRLIDIAGTKGFTDGLQQALVLGETILARHIESSQKALLYYDLANAWMWLYEAQVSIGDASRSQWEQKELEQALFLQRKACQEPGFCDLPEQRQCQILTNLGNTLNTIGRFSEAVGYWNRALLIIPDFPMALGNRGFGLYHYARSLWPNADAGIVLKFAFIDLNEALQLPLESYARSSFVAVLNKINNTLSGEYLAAEPDFNRKSLGETQEEVEYRRWCLRNALFLNHLNDLNEYTNFAHDCLHLPSMVVPIGSELGFYGFFNQLKQEYVSARYILYEGLHTPGPHFSDHDVDLVNTLDYPSYSLSTEKTKIAFRVAYSILDKITLFLERYYMLPLEKKMRSFRNLWYEGNDRNKGLRPLFSQRKNWALRGLFWLSKDLAETDISFQQSLEPELQDVALLRNKLEHSYLKLHLDLWSKKSETYFFDEFAESRMLGDFCAKSINMMRMARAALMYLFASIVTEEALRKTERGDEFVGHAPPLDKWEDEWKV